MARVVLTPGWELKVDAAADRLVDRVVEEVADDARRLAPVRTGHLRDSIHVEGHSVKASADYAAYVELGTRYMHAEPYLRPALYKKRG